MFRGALATGQLRKQEEEEAAARKAAIQKVVDETRKELDPTKMGGKRHRVTSKRFCSCIKKVRASKKPKTEGSAIAICTSSLLWPHGKTLHSVTCRLKKSLKTQKRRVTGKK